MRERSGFVVLALLPCLGSIGLAGESPPTSHAGKAHGASPHGGPPHWSYQGPTGPEHWSELSPAFAACAKGRFESPIDIESAEASELPPLQFDYKPSPLTVVDNGHTIMATYAPGSSLVVGDARYDLQQVHFHHPSEEQIHGKTSEMVVHLVHKDTQGHLAVVAVLLNHGMANPAVGTIWAHLPAVKEKPQSVAGAAIDATALLPATRGYYTFSGSLTTPPCTEGVTWYVMTTPVELSAEQIAAFAKLYPMNARPVQPLNGRKIRETKD
ncbi:MAG TPA: carbonic anhydrase family protein [Candidatus Eisenbacteria bacterium]|nr:carbonic anhydrase family protein [Candidatus Eisenbacteria bacterium]